jgi:hypothetical protein
MTARSWYISIPGRAPFEVHVVPEATEREMRLQYPGAIVIEPLIRTRRTATPAESAELRELIGMVAADWPEEERAAALDAAESDPEPALICWRALAVEHTSQNTG